MAKVLVVAENSMARLLTWILEQGGHSVRAAFDPAEGMRYAAEDHPDVIVINGVLPTDELDPFIQRLGKRSPISRVLEVARPAGSSSRPPRASGHLTQPFDADDLLQEI